MVVFDDVSLNLTSQQSKAEPKLHKKTETAKNLRPRD